jgi:tetratricopeptide (TPR) repeat protein
LASARTRPACLVFRRLADRSRARVATTRQSRRLGIIASGRGLPRRAGGFHTAAFNFKKEFELFPPSSKAKSSSVSWGNRCLSLPLAIRQWPFSTWVFMGRQTGSIGISSPPHLRLPLTGARLEALIAAMIPTPRLVSRAQGYLELGMVADAAAELDRIPVAEIDGIVVVAVRLALLQEQQDWPAASQLAAAFVRRKPKEAAGWVTWAYATRRAVSLEAAEKILLEAEKLHPAEATIQFNLGCYACQRNDLVTARQRVDRAIALNAKFAKAAETDPDLAPLRTTVTKKRR